MDSMGIASIASNMKTAYLHSEVAFRVMKMAMDVSELQCDAIMEMMDVAMTGIGENLDMLA